RAAIKDVAATTRFFLHQLAIFSTLGNALRTLHSDEILLHVLAFWIAAARNELTVTSVAQHHIAFALRTRLFERHIGNLLSLIETPRRLALGISGAGHELTKAPALEDHHAPAVLAVFLL